MVTPITMGLALIKTTMGTTGSLTNEAMSELDWTALGYADNSVYEITDPTKRYLARSAVPTFEVDTGGGFAPATPDEIQYPGGIVIFNTPLGGTDVVRCATATYYTTQTTFLGGNMGRLTVGPTLQDVTSIGDPCVKRYPTVQDFSFTLDSFAMKTEATYTTSGGNANSHITFEHEDGGVAGNAYSITMVDPGAPGSLSVGVVGTDVTVTLAYATGAITSTATQVVHAIWQSTDCATIKFSAQVKDGETGAGIVAALGHTHLSGGLDATDQTAKFQIPLIVSVYSSSSSDERWEGYCYLESLDEGLDPKSVLTENLSFKGDGKLYYRPS